MTTGKGFHYKGKLNDNYRANAYTLKCMYVSLAVLAFCWVLDVFNIFIVDLKIMSIAAGGAVILCALAFGYAFFIGIDSSVSRYVIMFLLIAMATLICTELAYHTTMFLIFPLVCSAQYFDRRVTVFTAVFSCAGCAAAVMLGYRIGLCDSNMLLLTYTNSAYHASALASGAFTINTDLSLMFLFFVFPRWLIILALLPLLNHVSRDIQIRTAREATARHQAEIDGLTGLYNRTKYLQAVNNFYPKQSKAAVLFFDINNLKTVNDTRGHEFGDILICGLANHLSALETPACKTYRLGGDEFVMILTDKSKEQAVQTKAELTAALQDRPLDENIRLSVAIGFAYGKGTEVEALVKIADEDMYRCKQAMKAQVEK